MNENSNIERIAKRAQQRVTEAVGSEQACSACLLHAAAFLVEAEEAGAEGWIIQGGTAFWPRLPTTADPDDEQALFGYEWDYIQAVRASMEGRMPEVHFWVAHPDSQTICDPSSWSFPQQARTLAGLGWDTDEPPSAFIAGIENLPPRVAYIASVAATSLALQLVPSALDILFQARPRNESNTGFN